MGWSVLRVHSGRRWRVLMESEVLVGGGAGVITKSGRTAREPTAQTERSGSRSAASPPSAQSVWLIFIGECQCIFTLSTECIVCT